MMDQPYPRTGKAHPLQTQWVLQSQVPLPLHTSCHLCQSLLTEKQAHANSPQPQSTWHRSAKSEGLNNHGTQPKHLFSDIRSSAQHAQGLAHHRDWDGKALEVTFPRNRKDFTKA